MIGSEGAGPRVELEAEADEPAQFLEDVRRGLGAPRKFLPSKWLYDARGSALYELICELPEYYPYRTELAILDRPPPRQGGGGGGRGGGGFF